MRFNLALAVSLQSSPHWHEERGPRGVCVILLFSLITELQLV